MKYCCKEFEINTVKVMGCFERQEDNTWDITVGPPNYVIRGMKFCPFCGKADMSRFTILEAEDLQPYWVYDGSKQWGLFESRQAAQGYVDKEEA